MKEAAVRLWFYLNYALRNLWRSRRWSAFAVFSVAAGVATYAVAAFALDLAGTRTALMARLRPDAGAAHG